jgi:hypothetical protein
MAPTPTPVGGAVLERLTAAPVTVVDDLVVFLPELALKRGVDFAMADVMANHGCGG